MLWKNGQRQRATCFATLLQKELICDVALFSFFFLLKNSNEDPKHLQRYRSIILKCITQTRHHLLAAALGANL